MTIKKKEPWDVTMALLVIRGCQSSFLAFFFSLFFSLLTLSLDLVSDFESSLREVCPEGDR